MSGVARRLDLLAARSVQLPQWRNLGPGRTVVREDARLPAIARDHTPLEEIVEMRKLLSAAAALAAGTWSLNAMAAQQTQQQTAAQEDMKATGMVTKVDQESIRSRSATRPS